MTIEVQLIAADDPYDRVKHLDLKVGKFTAEVNIAYPNYNPIVIGQFKKREKAQKAVEDILQQLYPDMWEKVTINDSQYGYKGSHFTAYSVAQVFKHTRHAYRR